MSLPWFRLYTELKDDPKIGGLQDLPFRVFVLSLCWAGSNGKGGSTGITMESANWAFRCNVTEALQSLFQVQLLHLNENGEIVVTNFEKRQMKSDISNERVRKHREQKRSLKQGASTKNQPEINSKKEPCNGDVTLHETGGNGDCNGLDKTRIDKSRVELSPSETAQNAQISTPKIPDPEPSLPFDEKTKSLAAKECAAAEKVTNEMRRLFDLCPNFLIFWKAYPVQDWKGKAIKAWYANGCEDIADIVMQGLERHKKLPRWVDARYIPAANNWLTNRAWEDEAKAQAPKPKKLASPTGI